MVVVFFDKFTPICMYALSQVYGGVEFYSMLLSTVSSMSCVFANK